MSLSPGEVTLTPAQETAVRFPYQPSHSKKNLLLEAGAGAGKTQVLSLRVQWLVTQAPLELRLPPFRIYLVTFSRSADKVLRDRVEQQFAFSPENLAGQIHISTIDSLFMKLCESKHAAWWERAMKMNCTAALRPLRTTPPSIELVSDEIIIHKMEAKLVALLRRFALEPEVTGLTFDFILSGAFRGRATHQGVYHTGFGPTARVEILKAMLTETFLALDNQPIILAAKKIHPLAPKLIHAIKELARDQFYRRILNGQFTHSDKTLFLYNMYCAPIANTLGTPFESGELPTFPIAPAELIVDEYQDTNDIQHEILFHLATSAGGRMVVVGDPKQSIYGFRNARVEVFNRLKTHPDWVHLQLLANFRSDKGLLTEINSLSEITFQHKNPKIPESFWNSTLADSALRSHVQPLALDPGKIESQFAYPQFHPVSIVGASLNPARCKSDFELEKGLELPEFQLWTLVRHVQEAGQFLLQGQNNPKPWSQIAILCESNARVARVMEALAQFSIPAIASSSASLSAQDATGILANRVGLTLARILLGPISCLELYELLISPLVGLPHQIIEHFIWALRSTEIESELAWLVKPIKNREKSEKTGIKNQTAMNLLQFNSNFPELLTLLQAFLDHKKIASENFFAGWQTLRWKMANTFCSAELQPNARIFCTQLDSFAGALAAHLESPSVRREAEKCSGSLIESQIFESPLPDSLLHWNLMSLPTCPVNSGFDTVKVMTIHAAKGLEWPWVFFMPNASRDMPTEDFKMLANPAGRYLKWMQTDVESLSVVSRIENSHFSEDDSSTAPSGRTNSPQKIMWHADLQAKVEKEYERQRVFYTAFTRARNHLVVFYPTAARRSRKNLRDKLGDVKTSEAHFLNKGKIHSLEESVLGKYLDERFDLRKSGIRGAPPPEPWFEENPLAKPRQDLENLQDKSLKQNPNVRSLDYGPAWYPLFQSQWNASRSSMNRVNANFETEIPSSQLQLFGPTATFPVDWQLQPNPTVGLIEELEPSAKKSDQSQLQGALPRRYSKLSRRESSAKGLQYHAAQENALEQYSKSPAALLKKASYRYFEELEVWSTEIQEALFSKKLARTKRHILDLVCHLTTGNFPRELESFIPLQTQEFQPSFFDIFKNFAPETELWVVLDYKTGKVSEENNDQLDAYLQILSKLALSESQTRNGGKKTLPVILGLLCYDFKFAKRQGDSSERLWKSVGNQVYLEQYGLVFKILENYDFGPAPELEF